MNWALARAARAAATAARINVTEGASCTRVDAAALCTACCSAPSRTAGSARVQSDQVGVLASCLTMAKNDFYWALCPWCVAAVSVTNRRVTPRYRLCLTVIESRGALTTGTPTAARAHRRRFFIMYFMQVSGCGPHAGA